MAQELLKSFKEFDRIKDQHLSQIFASDEEIENIQALAAERSAEIFENCNCTKEEFEALMGEDLSVKQKSIKTYKKRQT